MTASKAKRNAKPVFHERLSDDLEQQIIREIDRTSDRSVAVVGGGLVEHALARAILKRFRPMNESEQREIFENENSVLATLHSKIQLGFALNLFSEQVRSDLRTIKRIRNIFAHRLQVSTFNHSDVVAECEKLICPQWQIAKRREKPTTVHRINFERTVIHLARRFYFEGEIEIRAFPGTSSDSYDAWQPSSPRKHAEQRRSRPQKHG
jgi:hypothetical protein